MKKLFYITWAGGVADYEGYSYKLAERRFNYWRALGYDDVILQTLTG